MLQYVGIVGKRLLCIMLAMSLVLLSVLGNPALAQSAADLSDSQPPVIELETPADGIAGETQVFVATVSDNLNLLAALLFYRFSGDEAFRSVDMQPINGTEIYSASIETSGDDVRDIEYFIQAEDAAGNRAIKGFTFDPLILTMRPPPQSNVLSESDAGTNNGISDQVSLPAEQTANSQVATQPEQSGGRKKLLWGLVGLLVVAAVAVALSNDDSGDGDDDGPAPVTLTENGSRLLSIQW